jgi:hypothetical protein
MGRRRSWLSLASIVIFAGCANLKTIDRTTWLPIEASENPVGKVIHLDAQQRLFIYRAGKYCAEPSPDALASYAAALGLGISIPSHGAGSLSQAQQSNAASIGLRTQSITLMRDALYRMCEAYHNGQLGETHVVTFLGRSQDLTAVILAVEQLTGVVAANQVALTETAGSTAAASLVSNQQLLDVARKNEQAKTEAVEASKKEQAATKVAADKAVADEAAAKAAYDAAVASGSSPLTSPQLEQQARLKNEWETKEADAKTAQEALRRADANVETNTKLLAEAKAVRETIEASRDAALTNASAETSGSAQFSTPLQQRIMSPTETREIANAVTVMVTQALKKSYTAEACMAFLTSSKSITDQKEQLLANLCADIIQKRLELEMVEFSSSLLGHGDIFASALNREIFPSALAAENDLEITGRTIFFEDPNTLKLQQAVNADPKFAQQLQLWLGSSISVPLLLYGSDEQYRIRREEAVQHFNL